MRFFQTRLTEPLAGRMLGQMSGRLVVGAMSGTSADGVDAALVRIGDSGLAMTADLLSHRHRPYPPDLRRAIFAVRSAGNGELAHLARMGEQITRIYALAVQDVMAAAGVSAAEIAAIAAHGQTLYHAPPLTIQWFDPSLLAWETGCPVVSDFRRADCAAGGQGAPLVPFADYLLFRDPTTTRVLLNLGGIANITILRAGSAIDQIVAFDTGPGNCISDWLCQTYDPAGLGFDLDGRVAESGRLCDELYRDFVADPYFNRPPPKSTDGPDMIRLFQQAMQKHPGLPLPDLLYTACRASADMVLAAIECCGITSGQIIVSGGGTGNRVLMACLANNPRNFPVLTTDVIGVPAAAREGIAFALLGAATLDGIPSNVPLVTGASRPVVLGSITPRL